MNTLAAHALLIYLLRSALWDNREMDWLSPRSQTLAQWVNDGLLGLTLYFLLKYTKAAQDQVKVSRAQFEGTARPVLTFEMDFDSGPRTPATLPLINFRLRNVGVGPAFNVQIQDTIYDDFKARWDPIDIIRQQTTQPVSFYVTDVNTGEFQPGPRTIGCLARLLMGRNFSPEHPAAVLKVYYEDLSRQPHTTEAELRYQYESADIVIKYRGFT